MIEINLLPGSAGKRKASRGGAGAADFRAKLSGVAARVKDPYLLAAIAGVVLGAGVVGAMYVTQNGREAELVAAEEQAMSDSTRMAKFLKQRVQALATRDTVLRQINVIEAIDGDRYLWPHILEEVSAAMPQYTWLTSLAYTGTPQGSRTLAIIGGDTASAGPAARPAAAARKDTAKVASVDTVIVRDTVTIAIEGQTVDIEGITRFMRQLEASPFIDNVQLGKSQLSIVGRREITSFSLQANYARVDSGSVIQRVPLRASISGGEEE